MTGEASTTVSSTYNYCIFPCCDLIIILIYSDGTVKSELHTAMRNLCARVSELWAEALGGREGAQVVSTEIVARIIGMFEQK